MSDKEKSATELIDEAYAVHAVLATSKTRLDEISAALIALGKGKYSGTNPEHVATVIVPSAPEAGYKLESKNEARARDIAGKNFGIVFDRKISFAPCKAFVEICAKVLTPAKREKLLALCRVTRKTQDPYVNFA
ncbi:MAG TPA: hypothetical protein VJS88_06115 [Chthoniobacterales bacterium]|nr:hypothetical protein [Chthoniobacterales bacterium]